MEMIAIFIAGFIFGILILAACLMWQLSKTGSDRTEDIIESIDKEIEKISLIKGKFDEINEIHNEQQLLISHIERPSASASHSISHCHHVYRGRIQANVNVRSTQDQTRCFRC